MIEFLAAKPRSGVGSVSECMLFTTPGRWPAVRPGDAKPRSRGKICAKQDIVTGKSAWSVTPCSASQSGWLVIELVFPFTYVYHFFDFRVSQAISRFLYLCKRRT